MPEIVAAFCWYAYLYQGGTLDSFLHHLGLSQDWLYTTPMLAIIIANVWRGTAFSMLVYSAAMSDLPPDLLEAAQVDGASPALTPAPGDHPAAPPVHRDQPDAHHAADLGQLHPHIRADGWRARGRQPDHPIYIYQQALQLYDISYGTAMCIVLLLIGAIFSVVYMKLIKVEETI